MYNYKLEMSYENDSLNDGVGLDVFYLTHNNKYSTQEFEEICKKASMESMTIYNELTLYTLVKVLKEKYGFKGIMIEASFGFEENAN